MELIKYRDAGMASYTWFWVNEKGHIVSPFFDSEQEANSWLEQTRPGNLVSKQNK